MRLTRRGRAPAGFSLAELLIALVLLGIVGLAIMTTLTRQQRFYRVAGDLLQTRSQIRQATSALPADLRAISSASADIRAMSASSIEFDATIGTGIVCGVSPALSGTVQEVYLLPSQAAGGRFTGWASPPQAGDRASLYDPAAGGFSAPLPLAAHGSGAFVADAPPDAAPFACPGSPFLNAADNARARPWVRVNVAGTPLLAARGTAIRILRHVRYSLVQSPHDQQWYLGYEEFNGGASTGVRAMSGPYRPLAADTTSGLSFAYFDANNAPLAPTATGQVARIDVVVRALTQGGAPGTGSKRADGRLADSDRLVVGLRN